MRFLIAFISSVIATSAFSGRVNAVEAKFSDIGGHPEKELIEKHLKSGLLKGYPGGAFRPDEYSTRAEVVSLFSRGFGMESENGRSSFPDVKGGQWFYKDIGAAESRKYIIGFPDGSFKPNENAVKLHALVVLYKMLDYPASNLDVLKKYADEDSIPSELPIYRRAVAFAAGNGLLATEKELRVLDKITRAEALLMLDKAISLRPAPTPPQNITPAPSRTPAATPASSEAPPGEIEASESPPKGEGVVGAEEYSSYEIIKNALKTVKPGSILKLPFDLRADSDAEIPEGATLQLDKEAKITIPDGCKVIFSKGAKLSGSGGILVEAGGTVLASDLTNGIFSDETAYISVEKDGQLTEGLRILVGDKEESLIKIISGRVLIKKGGIEVDGKVKIAAELGSFK
ncbi:MAG: S-layer homology domain-containing protein [Clostridiales bacterium]|nr:S-layer homology domain-containing protein [Clostridiales bacterium]